VAVEVAEEVEAVEAVVASLVDLVDQEVQEALVDQEVQEALVVEKLEGLEVEVPVNLLLAASRFSPQHPILPQRRHVLPSILPSIRRPILAPSLGTRRFSLALILPRCLLPVT